MCFSYYLLDRNVEFSGMVVRFSRGNDSSLSSLYSVCFFPVNRGDRDTLPLVDIQSASELSAVAILVEDGKRFLRPRPDDTPLPRPLIPPRRFLYKQSTNIIIDL